MADEEHDAQEQKVKRVWILGAGFSRPLGGPLLADLFTMRGYRKLQRVFSDSIGNTGNWLNEKQAFLHAVYALYHWGRGFPEGHLFGVRVKENGEQLFGHAEDFLVEVDKMSSMELLAYWRVVAGSQRNSVLGKVHEQLAHFLEHERHELFARGFLEAANRLMAFECSAFHQELIGHSGRIRTQWKDAVCEPFLPYEAWAASLGKADALVVFNYDNVTEFFIKSPHVKIVKMHGSVERRGTFEQRGYANLQGEDYSPNIGIPGTSKANKDFQTEWEEAARYLRSAGQITFMGYGLPESDAKAREFLLSHLRNNHTALLKIEVVLGEPSFRTQRLDATLRQALAHRLHSREDREAHATELNHSESYIRNLKDWLERGQFPVTLLDGEGERANIKDPDDAKKRLILEEKRFQRLSEDFKELTLTVLPQYAQDYMQGFATHEGGNLK